MKTRFISAQVLLNKDTTMKAQRVYAIPVPSVVSFYADGFDADGNIVTVGVIVQDWKTSEVLDKHPDLDALLSVLSKSFGLWALVVKHG